MERTYNLTDTLICTADQKKDEIVLFIADQTKTQIVTPTTENKILVENAHDAYCKTEKLQVGAKDPTPTLISADL